MSVYACRCKCCEKRKYGGPNNTKETCKNCGKEWIRYRGGSYDWEYKDCLDCSFKDPKKLESWLK